ncbi:MAG: hypothetical protein NT167_31350 [Verrucomicrobia bacterium]|nr:hypothetical protein [Verrucomicrobiota bacterium]
MNAIQKVALTIIATIMVAADANAGRWLSRDPIQEGAGFVQRDPKPPLEFIPVQPRRISNIDLLGKPYPKLRDRSLQALSREPNPYAFVLNNPENYSDPFGLTTWKGKCSFISAGEFIGGMVIDCDLVSFCEVGDDNHREYAHVVGFILDLTVSIPIEITVSDNTFKTPGKTGYKAFRGSAAIANIGWATGPVGFALYKIKLGEGVSEGIGSEQLGLALGETAGFGFSISKGTKQCCNGQ